MFLCPKQPLIAIWFQWFSLNIKVSINVHVFTVLEAYGVCDYMTNTLFKVINLDMTFCSFVDNNGSFEGFQVITWKLN